MCPDLKKLPSRNTVFGFTYPVLHTGKEWYVDFYCHDPASGRMRRKKYMVNRPSGVVERKRQATEMMSVLVSKLRSGWNPWVYNSGNDRVYVTLEKILMNFLRFQWQS